MAGSYIEFVEGLIYGTGLAPAQNHRDWVAANPSPDGLEWLAWHVDKMLAAYEAWTVAEALPPVTPWDGVRRAPWDATLDLPLPAALDGSFTGVATLTDLGDELATRYASVASVANELNGIARAPFGYRYWSYMRWARDMRRRFQGEVVFPVGHLLDRDGTPLSATPFCDTFNDLHRNWHLNGLSSGIATPGLRSTAGQRTGAGLIGFSRAEDFLLFHRDHGELFRRWLARTRQPAILPQDMGRAGGWPPSGPPPVVDPPAPWSYDEASFAASGLPALTALDDIGGIEFGYHVAGHVANSDIGPLAHNNYVPRFHSWHNWIDAQWWWREPRFAQSDPVTGERTRVFRPVLQDGSDFAEPLAISIVRDPTQPADAISPPNAVGALDLATGAGTLRVRLYVRDPLSRSLRMRLTAEVLDGAGAVVPGSTVTLHRTIGPAGDHPLDAEFDEDLVLAAGTFASDDPARANPAVGFVNGQVRVTGMLWVPGAGAPDDPTQSPDPGFVHEDAFELALVREKLAPEVNLYQDLSSFSDDQVDATMAGGNAAFDDAFFVVAQDRTTSSIPAPAWPPLVADEVKGLILGLQAAAGLFDDDANAPDVVLWQETVDAPFAGVTVRRIGPPAKEDPALPSGLPQRFTWRYAIDFAAGHDAFDGLAAGDRRSARLRVTVRDRAGNATTAEATVTLFRGANPYMTDGPTPWLSVDTRAFSLRAGQSKLGEAIAAGQPLAYLEAILDRLNAGTTGAETFETLAESGPGAALEYAAAIPDPEAGTSTPVYNFALAKVRLRGATGAERVRMFFRLFRYAEPSLRFEPTTGYRAFDDGADRIVPLLGFESTAAGAPLRSIPFFAEARVDPETVSMQSQVDPLNVHDFPAGPTDERVWYFGAWLDFNVASARLPGTAQPAADGPFPLAALTPLSTLMRDFHQCMVAEIRYEGDPTEPAASPAASDNLAQRNLAILTSANPGDRWTRTVEHAFEIDLSRARDPRAEELTARAATRAPEDGECEHCGHDGLDADGLCACCGGAGDMPPLTPADPFGFQSSFAFARLVDDQAMSIAMSTPHDDDHNHDDHDHEHEHDEHEHDEHEHEHEHDDHEHEHEGHDAPEGAGAGEHGHRLASVDPHRALVPRFRPQAAREVRRAFPFVFHPTRWSDTTPLLDELMIDWGNLPLTADARLFLPGVAPEQIVNLRNLRHAPETVVAAPDATLRLRVGGVTFVPLPPVKGDRLPGALTITLPAGVKAGERYVVDVTHLRAGATVRDGGFRVEIVVDKAARLLRRAATQVVRLHEQLAATPVGDRWHPVLEHRLRTDRLRARGLAEDAGMGWDDPTVWTDEDGHEHPVVGSKIRVVLERIRILDDRDPWPKGAGEVELSAIVRTESNGGFEQRTRLPANGAFKLSSGDELELEATIFEGFAEDDLGIRIDAVERDTHDPDDNLGSYTRTFSCDAESWLGRYGPGSPPIDPEHVGYWQVFYRIERG